MNLASHDGLFATGLDPSDYDLPHPRIHLRVMLLVRQVFIEAFALLRERCASAPTPPLATWQEDQITVALRAIIENDLRQKGTVPGFNRRSFETVFRQTEVMTFDQKSFGRKPDMLFRLHRDEEPSRILSTEDGLFVECKPVDVAHPAGGDYCDAGLQRFVEGTYAWAMQDALMVGYVRDSRTIQRHLCRAINDRADLCTITNATPISDAGAGTKPETEALHASTHRRPISWVGGKGPACPITVYHSWHRAT